MGKEKNINYLINDVAQALDNQTLRNEISNFSSSVYSSMMESISGISISRYGNYFKDINDVAMRHHMKRNDVQKSLIQSAIGENAYYNGDSENFGMPVPEFSYSTGHSYTQFSSTIPGAERSGVLTDSDRDIKRGEKTNYYYDYYGNETESDNGSLGTKSSVLDINSSVAQDSLLYKTRKLFNQNKIKSIISKYYTGNSVRYEGQVGTEAFGESHGRNLLKKDAETNPGNYTGNGYDNPYCRVWTHYNSYDRFSKTMRSFGNQDNINYWGEEFEWNESDLNHNKNNNGYTVNNNNTKVYTEGENYDYAWRGFHNQERRRKNSVLDTKTGLVNIAPKLGDGNTGKIHTKSCMFSIENLAWKDYDPYSFENALSWEQRGPLGGRIMWFPPYNLKVTETNSARWNNNDFIGRGEPVYTYVNSERTGTLTFTMLVDHPSSIDYASWYPESDSQHDDNDYLRYFAGCMDGNGVKVDDDMYKNLINNKVSKNGGDNLLELPTRLTDEYDESVITPNSINKPQIKENKKAKTESSVTDTVEFYVFFPNNYSGVYDIEGEKYSTDGIKSEVDAMLYLLMGNGAQKKENGIKDSELHIDNISNSGNGYEMTNDGIGEIENSYVKGTSCNWYYRIDCFTKNDVYNTGKETETSNTITQNLKNANLIDSNSSKLNSSVDEVKKTGLPNNNELYSFAEVAYALYENKGYTKICEKINELSGLDDERIGKLYGIFAKEVVSISCNGNANSQGSNQNTKINNTRNTSLAEQRGNTVKNWLRNLGVSAEDTDTKITYDIIKLNESELRNVNNIKAKCGRCTHVVIKFSDEETQNEETSDNESDGNNFNGYVGFTKEVEKDDIYKKTDDGTKWKLINGKLCKFDYNGVIKELDKNNADANMSREKEFNKLRYDQEYYFYQKYMEDHPFVYSKLKEKIKYFNPVFHSMTPEGFNGRLTFLNQCTRQGSTLTKSDPVAGNTANNLAFGRPPFCVLRLGDFYNQLIVIESINYNFDVSGGLMWDLNTEGNGVQPMLCDVNITFKFIGGGDITGPVRRLQNAMSFNYYANTSFYDNRADRVEYESNERTIGAAGNNKVLEDKSYSYTPGIYSGKK